MGPVEVQNGLHLTFQVDLCKWTAFDNIFASYLIIYFSLQLISAEIMINNQFALFSTPEMHLQHKHEWKSILS